MIGNTNYILITPIKDEINNLLKLKEVILNQTVRPMCWVIGDGNSKDGSFQIAKELFKDFDWIHIINQKTFFESGYSHKNIAGGLNDCYNYAKEITKANNIEYNFVARTDATPVLSNNYFEVIIEEMKKDARLAFACGIEIFQLKNSKVSFDQVAGISRTGYNDIGVYRKSFLEDMKEFPTTYSPETVLQIKALNRGWKLKRIEKTYFFEPRLGGSKIGVWNGYKLKGRVFYSLGYTIPLIIFSTMYHIFKYTPRSIGILFGYFSSYIKKEKKINDQEVLEYFGHRMRQVILDLNKSFFKKF